VTWESYNAILQEEVFPYLKDEKGIKTMQKVVRSFRKCYDVDNDIDVSYQGDLERKAYFLTYFPAHARQMQINLSFINNHISRLITPRGFLKASFFACGPGSEFYGFISFLQKEKLFPELDVHFIDREVGWKPYIIEQLKRLENRGYKTISRNYQDCFHQCTIEQCGLCKADCKVFIGSPQLVVMQNVINEKTFSREKFINSIDKLLAKLKTGSILVFSETLYHSNKEFLEEVFAILQNSFKAKGLTAGCQPRYSYVDYDYLPETLRVLNGESGLIRKTRVNSYFLALQK